MADLTYTFRAKNGATVEIVRPNGGASAYILVTAASGVDVPIALDAEELRDLAGGLAIVRDYR
jgi:allophanate hydrolase subunit 2